MTQISSIFNANGLIAKIAKKEGFDGEPPTLADIQDMAIATPESVTDVAITPTEESYRVITKKGMIHGNTVIVTGGDSSRPSQGTRAQP